MHNEGRVTLLERKTELTRGIGCLTTGKEMEEKDYEMGLKITL